MTSYYDLYQGSYYMPLTNFDNLMEQLSKDGVAIIPNILNQDQINYTTQQMHNWLENIFVDPKDKIKMNDVSTYRNFYKLMPLHGGILQHFGIGHQQFVWDIRQNRQIIEIFSHIWNVSNDDLLVSFDGVNFNFPPEFTKRAYYRGGHWFHTDQANTKIGLHCVQGMINIFDIEQGDATFSVLTGSNNLHEEFMKEHNINTSIDWYRISDANLQWFIDKGCKWKNILAPAGSIILWDSRLFHMAMEATLERPKPHFRFGIYVCMLPKSKAKSTDIEKRILAFNQRRMTTHWPYNKFRLFPKFPRTYGIDLPILNNLPIKLKLKSRALGLIGFKNKQKII